MGEYWRYLSSESSPAVSRTRVMLYLAPKRSNVLLDKSGSLQCQLDASGVDVGLVKLTEQSATHWNSTGSGSETGRRSQ